jgi:phosphoglycerol transferase MdoB-like AlkP superfamily enzyme
MTLPLPRRHTEEAPADEGRTPAPPLTPYRGLLAPLAVAYLLIGAALRVVLWTVYAGEARYVARDLVLGLACGAINDAVTLVYLLLPLTLFLMLLPARLGAGWVGRALLGVVLYVCLFGALLLAVMEFYFFDEFQARFNLVAVDYLIYPTEVFGNIEESYPVPQLLAAIAVTAALGWIVLWRWLRRVHGAPPPFRFRGKVFLANALAVTALALIVPSDWLSLSSNSATNELAKNGVSTFFRAFRTENIDYPSFYATLPRARAFAIMRDYLGRMGGKLTSDDPYSLTRTFPGNPAGLGKLNVVVLSEESFGAQYVGAYGDTHGLTPIFDALAKGGFLFRNAFATGTRTVRGLEAMSASFPPIPSEAIVKRVGSENISNWGAIMRDHGYAVSFLYGGFGAFDNMNHYFGSNGFALSDRLDIPSPKFTNIWGVSDEDLFRHAVDYFDQVAKGGKPFFSIIMSTSNHKPFTFPPGVPGVPPEGGSRPAGVRYADYAIGQFFAEARSRPWFGNTLFVIIADHDSRVYGSAEVPVEHYRIPLLLLSPGHLAPGESDKDISNMDLAPTVLGLLGLPYTAPFYGVNVLDPVVPARRPVLFSHNHEVAIFENPDLSVVGLRRIEESYHYANGESTLVAPDRQRLDLLVAYLQTAYELFREHRY